MDAPMPNRRTDDIMVDVMLWNAMEEEEEEEEGEEDAEEEDFLLVLACVLGGVAEVRQRRSAARHRLYLTRAELMPNPGEDSAWQRLFVSQNDRAFITTMGIDVQTFNTILSHGFALAWNTTPIPRADVSQHGNPRLGRRSLDAAGALGLVLHWLNSTMREVSLQQIFALVPSTVNRYLHAATNTLSTVLDNLPEADICWPRGEEFRDLSKLVQRRHPSLRGAFGVVDGLNLPVQVSADEDIENATYNGWKRLRPKGNKPSPHKSGDNRTSDRE